MEQWLHANWPWVTLVLLGAYHGLNPAMGWLFAVALGLQERSRKAVLSALPPMALGHAASIGIVALVVLLAQAVMPAVALKWAFAALLASFGIYKLIRSRHPRWVGMQVGFKDLAAWSFVMASAHGAGLMLAPVLLRLPKSQPMPGCAMPAMATPAAAKGAAMASMIPLGAGFWLSALAVGLHTLAMLVVAGLVAALVYEKLGVRILTRAWFNLDYLWAGALLVAAVLSVAL